MDLHIEHKSNFAKINRKKVFGNLLQAAPFILPGLILVSIFVIYPMLNNIRISFSDYKITANTMTFLGFENYSTLFHENRFWISYRNNILYALITTPLIMLIGLIFAVLINSLKRGMVIFRTGFYLPVITSWVIIGLVFLYLFNANQRGLVNYILVDVLHFMPHYVSWLQNEWSGNLVIWIMGVWKNAGWAMIIYLAALQGISKDLYEASSIEGAGGLKKFFRITIPLLKKTNFFVLVQMIIGSFNVFIQVFILTKGNPGGRTSVLQYLLYDRSFNLFQFGQGAAIGVITGITIFAATLAMNRLTRDD